MQPDRNPTDWQQPKEQPSQAPYTAPSEETPPQSAPVVTLSPDTPASTDQAPAEEDQLPASVKEIEPVRWQASEYIHREKNSWWFVIFTIVVLILMAAAIFLIKSVTFAVLIPVMAVALLVYNHRPPRVLDYTLSRQGLHINDKLYPFAEFKGFGVIHDDDEYSVMLLPVKRFRPGVSVYFPEEAGEAIVDMLGARLPMQELRLDIYDRIIRRLRI